MFVLRLDFGIEIREINSMSMFIIFYGDFF